MTSCCRFQRGFTITELMITVGLSLSVISSVLFGYLATYTSALDTLAASKLNLDMSALMNLMVSELRRAGHSSAAIATPAANPFALADATALEVFNNIASNTQQSAKGSGACVVYSYDMDTDGSVDTTELAGFRLTVAGAVQMRTTGNIANPDTCATAFNTWTELTDPEFITVSALTFDLQNSECLNTREPNGLDDDSDAATDEADEGDCYANVPAPGSGDITVEAREIIITLTAELARDSFIHQTQKRNVKVRNDLVRVR